jgi:predicted ATPase
MIIDTFVHCPSYACDLRSRFIGKERRVAEVKKLLTTTRLLTIVGTGGSGKTQLGLHLMADLQQDFEQAVWRVDVTVVPDATEVVQALAQALDIEVQAGHPLIHAILDFLRPHKKALLIIDHCEHLISSYTALVKQLLHGCEGVHILCVSREVLGIADEVIWQMPLLRLPDLRPFSSVDELMRYEAIQLFNHEECGDSCAHMPAP